MDFIERLFGISPDGGDRSTEALYIFALIAILALVIAGPLRKRMIRKRRD